MRLQLRSPNVQSIYLMVNAHDADVGFVHFTSRYDIVLTQPYKAEKMVCSFSRLCAPGPTGLCCPPSSIPPASCVRAGHRKLNSGRPRNGTLPGALMCCWRRSPHCKNCLAHRKTAGRFAPCRSPSPSSGKMPLLPCAATPSPSQSASVTSLPPETQRLYPHCHANAFALSQCLHRPTRLFPSPLVCLLRLPPPIFVRKPIGFPWQNRGFSNPGIVPGIRAPSRRTPGQCILHTGPKWLQSLFSPAFTRPTTLAVFLLPHPHAVSATGILSFSSVSGTLARS